MESFPLVPWRKAVVSLSSLAALALVAQQVRSAKKRRLNHEGEGNVDSDDCEKIEGGHEKPAIKDTLDAIAAVRVEAATGETLEQQSQTPSQIVDASCDLQWESRQDIQNELRQAVSEEVELRSQLQLAASEKLDLQNKLQDALDDGRRSEVKLRGELEVAASQENDLQGKLQDAIYEESQLRAHLQHATSTGSELRVRLEDSESEKEQLRKKLEDSTSEEGKLRLRLQRASAEDAELRTELNDKLLEETQLRKQLQDTLSEEGKLRVHLQLAAAEDIKLRAELQEAVLRNQLHDSLTEEIDIQGTLEATMERNQQLRVEKTRVQTEEAKLAAEVHSAQVHYQKEESQFQRQRAWRQSELVEAERSCEAIVERLQGLEQDEVNLATKTAQRVALHAVHSKAAEDKAASLNSSILKSEKHCQQLSSALSEVVAEATDLKGKCREAVADLEAKRKDFSELSKQTSDVVGKHSLAVADVESKRRELAALAKESADLVRKQQQATAEVELKRRELSELSKAAADLTRTSDKAAIDTEIKRRKPTEVLEDSADLATKQGRPQLATSSRASEKVQRACDNPAELPEEHAVLSKMQHFNSLLQEAADLAEKRRQQISDISRENSCPDIQAPSPSQELHRELTQDTIKVQREASSKVGSQQNERDDDDKSENTDGNLEDVDGEAPVEQDVDGEAPVEQGRLIIPVGLKAHSLASHEVASVRSDRSSCTTPKRTRLLEENDIGVTYEVEKVSQMSIAKARRDYATTQQKYGRESLEAMRVAGVLAQQLEEMSDSLDEVERLLRGAYSGFTQKLGADHLETLQAANSLAVHLDNAEETEEAIQLYRQASMGRKKDLGAVHPHTLDSTYNLAQALASSGETCEAEELFREVYAGCMETFGLEHHGTMDCLEKLVELLHEQGSKKADREQLCCTLLEARIAYCGAQHPSTLKASVLLIDPILDRDLSEAMKAYQDAMQGYEVALGADDPESFELASVFASSLAARGNRKEAQQVLEDALRTCETKYGADSAAALDYVDDIAIFLANGGVAAEAEQYFKRAHQTRCQLLGDSHEEALRSENNLAMFYDTEGMREHAARAYRSVYKGRAELLGESDPKTIEAAYNLAVALSASLRSGGTKEPQLFDDAVLFFKSALSSMEKEFGWTDDRTTNCAEKLAELYKASDCFTEAETYFRKVYDVQSSNPCNFSMAQVASAAYNLANCLMQLEKIADAEQLYFKAVTGYEHDSSESGDSSSEREIYSMDAVFNLAVCLQAQGKLDSAVPFFKRAVDGRARLLGPDHVETARASAALSQCSLACMSSDFCEPDAVRSYERRYD